jgi:hypothetical protein
MYYYFLSCLSFLALLQGYDEEHTLLRTIKNFLREIPNIEVEMTNNSENNNTTSGNTAMKINYEKSALDKLFTI